MDKNIKDPYLEKLTPDERDVINSMEEEINKINNNIIPLRYRILNKDINIKALLLMDFISVLLINFFLQPILAFTIYFCFLHSIRHSFKLSNELNTNNFVKGVKKFIIKAVPLTILTAILFLVSLFLLNNYYILDAAVSKVIFIGLASLTFPHILLEYLVEKNEK